MLLTQIERTFFNSFKKEGSSGFPDLKGWLGDGGKRWIKDGGSIQRGKGDHFYIFGNVDIEFMAGQVNRGNNFFNRSDEAIGAVITLQYGFYLFIHTVIIRTINDLPVGIGYPSFLKRCFKAFHPVQTNGQAFRNGKECGPAAAPA